MPFTAMLTDNGKEFDSAVMIKWAESKKIEFKTCVPYMHQNNGRIGRVNQKIREAL